MVVVWVVAGVGVVAGMFGHGVPCIGRCMLVNGGATVGEVHAFGHQQATTTANVRFVGNEITHACGCGGMIVRGTKTMQRAVGSGPKGGGVVGCCFLLSTPSVHIKVPFVRVARVSKRRARCWSEPSVVVLFRCPAEGCTCWNETRGIT